MRLLNFREIPFIRLLIPFIIGIAYALIFPLQFEVNYIFILTCAAGLAVCYLSLHYALLDGFGSMNIYCLLFLFGLNTINLRQQAYSKSEKSIGSELDFYKVQISSIPTVKRKSTKLEVCILAVNERSGWKHLENLKGVIYLNPKAKIPDPGDIIILKCRFKNVTAPENPYQFNYKKYLFNSGITKMTFVYDSNQFRCIETAKGYSIYRFSSKCQGYLKEVFSKHLKDTIVKATVESLVFGYKDEIPDEITRGYARTGTLHVLAVSGMHVALVFVVLSKLLGFIKGFKYSVALKVAIILVAIWMYCIITGLSPSVIRAGFMISFILIGKAINRYSNAYNIIGITALLILCYNPFWLINVGFQLSFTAVLGILMFNEKILKLFSPETYFFNVCWQLLSVTISAQIFTFPLSLFYFNQFPVYFLPANLVVIPLTTIIIYLSIGLLIVNGVPFLNHIICWFTCKIVEFTNWLVLVFEKMPGAIIDGISVSMIQLILIYLALFVLAIFIFFKRKPAFFVGLFLFTAVMFVNVLNKLNASKEVKFVKFNIPKANVFLLKNGKESILFKDTLSIDQISYYIKGYMVNNYVWPPKYIVDLSKLSKGNKISVHEQWIYKNNIIAWDNFRVFLKPELYERYNSRHKVGGLFLEKQPNLHSKHNDMPTYIVCLSHKNKILLSYYHRSVKNEYSINGFKVLKISI